MTVGGSVKTVPSYAEKNNKHNTAQHKECEISNNGHLDLENDDKTFINQTKVISHCFLQCSKTGKKD